MRRNLRYIWPRAESRIYDEAKRLVHSGYVTARTGASGRRQRTIYSITEAGRDALRVWLMEPAGTITLENEPLLRVLLGGPGRPEDLLAAVATVRAHAERMLAIGRPLAHEYLDNAHPQQHEVHLRALSFDYLYRWALLNRDWADRTEAEIARWSTVGADADKYERALRRIRAALSSEDGAAQT